MTKSNSGSSPQPKEKLAINSSRPPRLNVGKTAASSAPPTKKSLPKK